MTLKAWRVPGLQGRPVAQTPRKEWLLQSESKGGLQAEGPSSGDCRLFSPAASAQEMRSHIGPAD